jgi:hypothetical protein
MKNIGRIETEFGKSARALLSVVGVAGPLILTGCDRPDIFTYPPTNCSKTLRSSAANDVGVAGAQISNYAARQRMGCPGLY